MENSILILGQPGAGKTTLLDKYLSESEMENIIQLTFQNLALPIFEEDIDIFDLIGVDEVYSIEQLETIIEIMQAERVKFIVCSQLPASDIPRDILSKFEVVNLSTKTQTNNL